MLLAAAIVVLHGLAMVLEHVVAFVLDFPVRTLVAAIELTVCSVTMRDVAKTL
jgi:hypothetical protein